MERVTGEGVGSWELGGGLLVVVVGGSPGESKWWDTGSDLVTLPAAPGVMLHSGGRGSFMLT